MVKLLATVVTLLAATSSAMSTEIYTAVNFEGSYDDPNHPNCLRVIKMLNSTNVAVSGTDGNPGCPPDGSGEEWSLLGKVDDDTILVDFTPKGGPKDLKGVWESTPVPGIRWPDKNIWTKKQTVEKTS